MVVVLPVVVVASRSMSVAERVERSVRSHVALAAQIEVSPPLLLRHRRRSGVRCRFGRLSLGLSRRRRRRRRLPLGFGLSWVDVPALDWL